MLFYNSSCDPQEKEYYSWHSVRVHVLRAFFVWILQYHWNSHDFTFDLYTAFSLKAFICFIFWILGRKKGVCLKFLTFWFLDKSLANRFIFFRRNSSESILGRKVGLATGQDLINLFSEQILFCLSGYGRGFRLLWCLFFQWIFPKTWRMDIETGTIDPNKLRILRKLDFWFWEDICRDFNEIICQWRFFSAFEHDSAFDVRNGTKKRTIITGLSISILW